MPGPGKNAPGLTGFPTPNTTPDILACRVFRVPDNDDWLGLLMGAVEALSHEYNYYLWGTVTPDEAASTWASIVEQAYTEALSGACPADTPSPYWDDAADADSEAPAAEQVWYGEIIGGDFHEKIEDWAIAGFIAAAGQPAAAVYFLTVAPRFRLAWKTGDIGGIVRVFIDAEDYGTVDTSSDSEGIITMDIIPTTEADNHSILLVKEGA